MSARLLCLSAVSALVISACATSGQENPNYKYSTQYKAATPYQTASTQVATTPVQPAAYTTTTSQPVTYVPSQPVTYAPPQHVTYASNVQTQPAAPIVYQNDQVKMPVIQTSSVAAQPQPQYQYPQQQLQPQAQPQYGATYPASTPSPAPQPTYTAPTDQAYGDTYGTPGYHAVMAAQGQSQAQTAPAPVYSAPQTAYQQPQPTYTPQQPVYTPQQPMYQPQQAATPTVASNMHQVVEGDTVYSMSKRLCVTTQDIQRVNGLDANFNIKLGEFIQLPTSRC